MTRITKIILLLLGGLMAVASVVLTRPGRPRDVNRIINRIELQALGNILARYKYDCGMYPLTESGIEALVNRSPNLTCPKYPRDGYIPKAPRDADGKPFGYRSDGIEYELRTSDGQKYLGR